MPLCILHLEKKLSELDFWFSSYDHFSDITSKTPSSGHDIISLFFIKFFKNLRLFSERDFILKLRFCCSATRGSNLLSISKLRLDYSYIRHLR